MQSGAILFELGKTPRIGNFELPEPGKGESLIHLDYTCISPGTELRCVAGGQPNTPEGPYIPGYSGSGTIERSGHFPPGTRAFIGGTVQASLPIMWGGHVEKAVAQDARIYALPAEITMRDASLLHMAAIAYRGVRLAQPALAERVAVLGQGLIGQLSARLFLAAGAEVAAFDGVAERVELARQAGVDAHLLPRSIRDVWPDGADIVVDATGSEKAVQSAVDGLKLRPWTNADEVRAARLVVQGSYAGNFTLPYNELFLTEATVLIPRDSQPSDILEAMSAIASGRANVANLIGETPEPERAADVYARLAGKDQTLVTAAFNWRSA